MQMYTFIVGNAKSVIIAETATDAMVKANRVIVPNVHNFYGWFDAGPRTFRAGFGAWD